VWRSRNRVAGFALMLLMLIAGVMMAPKSYVERLSTIKTYQADGSARGRLEAWAVAWNMVKDRPMLGVGFAKFQQNYKAYDTRHSTDVDGIHDPAGTKVAHNSYFQIAAECGVPALLMYLALMGLSFRDIWKIRAEASRRYHSSWILSYATMFEASLVAFMVGSFFLNRAHFDLFYHFVAIVVVFGKVARESMADETITPVVSGERGTLSLIRQRTFGRVARASGFGRRPEPRGGFGKAS
jgi:probable O-glycosylation ligase (exosortase A-associated)